MIDGPLRPFLMLMVYPKDQNHPEYIELRSVAMHISHWQSLSVK